VRIQTVNRSELAVGLLKSGPLLRAMAHRRDPMGYTLEA
jgi:hypothetical protein